MKIVILQGAFLPVPPLLGGAVEKMWYQLGQEFCSRGHEVVHISRCYKDLPVKEVIGGVQHLRVEGYTTPSSGLLLKWYDLLYTWRAVKKARTSIRNADVVVTNTFFAPLLVKGNAKCYVDVQRMPKGQIKLYRSAGRLRANSTPVKYAIIAELGNQTSQVTMIPNPIPFIPSAEGNVTEKQKIVLYTGRIHPEKGLDILLKAFNLAGLANEGWQLNIVGPWDTAAGGGGEVFLNGLKQLAGNNTSIHFTGPVYDVEVLNNYYREAAVFAYPSVAEKGETFGISPLEGMAWGCVPVVSGLECFQDFIRNDQNGLIFNHRQPEPEKELAAHLVALSRNQERCHTLGREALKVRTSHSIQNIAGMFLDDFERLVKENTNGK